MGMFRQSTGVVIQPTCFNCLQICNRPHLGALQYRFLELCGWTVLVSIDVVRNETRRNVHARRRRDEQISCSENDRIAFEVSFRRSTGKSAKSASLKPSSHERLPWISQQTDQ